MKPLIAFLILSLFQCSGKTEHETPSTTTTRQVGGPCDGCDLLYEGQPPLATLVPTLELASGSEPGDQLVIKGKVVQIDGKTPAENVILYIYHTDENGRYSPGKQQTLGLRHGHLRGWLKTGADGHFTFKTIRPAAYPESKFPAHIHIFVKETDKNAYYIDEVRFLDDPKLTTEERNKAEQRGGDLNIPLEMDSSGVWQGNL
ncbi:MAG: intradiol ring-cleavage dioxygenase [Flavobacteriales bacterium]|nr:intradiol ring-cleavage dioxygenase [Flavobacteriales bacterium]MBK6943538.1 intradiol ring-cleavage dioxygenase [Flavobacteriales bacterium]MBK7240583.1 intradiol ring-cleavage dioxygenase [Flavobacteriales bacterium]MBK7297258.1 intradiol ring-cleavage dioxygenase [Flavobacteriales bacterium]MBK9535932.1 intradiol ring-cleavage dioxygenase [Flavobacteriales bacterium]